jgi:hypothetical protein
VAPEVDTVKLNVAASLDIEPAELALTIRGDCGDLHDSKTIKANVLPLRTLPAVAEKVPGCKVLKDSTGTPFYENIEVVKGNLRIPFVVVPSTGAANEPKTFYMMQTKVPIHWFRAFAQEKPGEVTDKEWEKLANAVKKEWETQASAVKAEQCPASGVIVEDADRFARWLGGKLPNQKEWNKAAGFIDTPGKKGGPFVEPWPWNPNDPTQISLDEKKPLPVGTGTHDISMFKVRDMAGYGREWTRETLTREVPLAKPAGGELVRCRGRNSYETGPLRFGQIEKNETEPCQYIPIRPLRIGNATEDASDISFRVVLVPE